MVRLDLVCTLSNIRSLPAIPGTLSSGIGIYKMTNLMNFEAFRHQIAEKPGDRAVCRSILCCVRIGFHKMSANSIAIFMVFFLSEKTARTRSAPAVCRRRKDDNIYRGAMLPLLSERIISTRRFNCLPPALSLLATGNASP